MASSRLTNIFRRVSRPNNVKFGWQQVRQESSKVKTSRSVFRRFFVPITAGNATLAFTIPGFSWGKKEESKKEQKQVDPVKVITEEADRLYSENKAEELYTYLVQFKDQENDEILWRLARAAVDKGKLSDVNEKKALYYEAYDYIKRALALNDNNFAVHKWYAVLLDYTGELEGKKQRIKNSYEVKEHFERAIELNPSDATSIHSLGYWCFTFASLTWYERGIAKTIYAAPPTATYEEALKFFLLAEETEPNFYSMNLLMLGKTYMKLQDAEKAYQYLTRCVNYPIKTPDDKKANEMALKELKVLGVGKKA
ncbi:regulator of microtubule dynamics [Mactra antiquata]